MSYVDFMGDLDFLHMSFPHIDFFYSHEVLLGFWISLSLSAQRGEAFTTVTQLQNCARIPVQSSFTPESTRSSKSTK